MNEDTPIINKPETLKAYAEARGCTLTVGRHDCSCSHGDWTVRFNRRGYGYWAVTYRKLSVTLSTHQHIRVHDNPESITVGLCPRPELVQLAVRECTEREQQLFRLRGAMAQALHDVRAKLLEVDSTLFGMQAWAGAGNAKAVGSLVATTKEQLDHTKESCNDLTFWAKALQTYQETP